MHITITAVGSRGDVQPFVALGKALRWEGHAVRVATHKTYAGLVGAHGLEFAPIEGNPREMFESIPGQAWLHSSRNPIAFWGRLRTLVRSTIEKSLSDAEDACRGTDAIIYTFFGAQGYHMAEKLGVPHVMALLQPFSRTREFPCCGAPHVPLGGGYNWWSYVLTEQLAWSVGRKWTNTWRAHALGLDPLPVRTPFSRLYERGEPFIYGFSEHVVPRPRDWPPTHEVTGYWFLDEADSWSPPATLLDFLAAGPPPVYVGFGSMTGRLADRLADISLEAVKLAGQRAVLVGGWAAKVEHSLPDWVYALPAAPHDWLFSRMAAVVHHGGAGTTAAGLRAGVPTVVVPLFADQPFWGARVHALGAGPRPVPRKRVSAQRLSMAIRRALSDGHIRRCASRLGKQLGAENGTAVAAERVLAHLSSR